MNNYLRSNMKKIGTLAESIILCIVFGIIMTAMVALIPGRAYAEEEPAVKTVAPLAAPSPGIRNAEAFSGEAEWDHYIKVESGTEWHHYRFTMPETGYLFVIPETSGTTNMGMNLYRDGEEVTVGLPKVVNASRVWLIEAGTYRLDTGWNQSDNRGKEMKLYGYYVPFTHSGKVSVSYHSAQQATVTVEPEDAASFTTLRYAKGHYGIEDIGNEKIGTQLGVGVKSFPVTESGDYTIWVNRSYNTKDAQLDWAARTAMLYVSVNMQASTEEPKQEIDPETALGLTRPVDIIISNNKPSSTPTVTPADLIKLTAASIPLQFKKTLSASKVVTALPAGDKIKTVTSDNTRVVKVTGTKLKATQKAGTANITVVTEKGATASFKIVTQRKEVNPKRVTVSNVKKKSVTMTKGQRMKLKPVVTPVTASQKCSFKSSDKAVAIVNSKGVITAKNAGTAKITVKAGGKKTVIKVVVKRKK